MVWQDFQSKLSGNGIFIVCQLPTLKVASGSLSTSQPNRLLDFFIKDQTRLEPLFYIDYFLIYRK